MFKNFIKKTRPFSWAYLIYKAEVDIINQKKKRLGIKNENNSIQNKRVQPWFKVNGDETLRLDYDLNESSMVFDVGGYKGEFARDIFCKYQSNIFIFEPLTEFYETISKRFFKNKKIQTFNFGLSDQTCNTLISLSHNSSSTISLGSTRVEISLVSILDFIKEHNVTTVDLLKLNIEGGEYNLLDSVIKNGDIKMFKNIQVQFHDFVIDDAKGRMTKIQNELSKTHLLSYQYEFVWENWLLKNDLGF